MDRKAPKYLRPMGMCLLAALVICLLQSGAIGHFAWTSQASSTNFQVNFALTTSSEVAVGMPTGYSISATNITGTSQKAVSHVDLVDQNNNTFHVYTSVNKNYNAGATVSFSSTFLTTTYSSLTGPFTVNGYLTDSKGNALSPVTTFTMQIDAVPSNNVYGSVGGVGPDSQLEGFRYDFSTQVGNFSSSNMSIMTRLTLTDPSSTAFAVKTSALTTVNAHSTLTAASTITTTQYSTLSGAFSLRLDVLDSTGTVTLASQTHNFTRNPLPTSYYMPSFTDTQPSSTVMWQMNNMMTMTGCSMMMGQGVAVGDYNGDGFPDIFVTDMMMGGFLYKNNGDGTFTDVTMEAFMGSMLPMMAASANFVDFNNDGKPDLFITTFDGMNALFENMGNGTFMELMNTGIEGTTPNGNVGAAWGDYDGDGFLDVYVINHGDCTGANNQGHLFHNNGNGTFTDVSSLLSPAPSSTAKGLAALFFDYNMDGKPDLYVGMDTGGGGAGNVLWKNAGGTSSSWNNFVNVSSATKAGIGMSDMGIGIGDYNRDGFYDLYLVNNGNNKLLRGSSSGNFTEVGTAANVAHPTDPNTMSGGTATNVGWSSLFADFNNDGWEDMVFGSGSMGGKTPLPNTLYLNNQDGTFLDLGSVAGITAPGMSARTLVVSDFNGDGFPDIFVTEMGGMPHLFINNGCANGNTYDYLNVKLVGNGTTSNKDAVGARVVASVGGAQLVRTVYNGGVFEGNTDLTLHFGLGSATQVDTLTITWPDGTTTTQTAVPGVAACTGTTPNPVKYQVLTITEP